MMYRPDAKDVLTITHVVAPTSNQPHSQNWTPDWNKLIARCRRGMREDAKARLAVFDHPRDTIDKRSFWRPSSALAMR
jgi:hypothetical protein